MSGETPPAPEAEASQESPRKTPGRSGKGKSGGYGSYAAINFIKDNNLLGYTKDSKRALECKFSSDRPLSDESLGLSPRGSPTKQELGQRAGPSRELARLRAELEMVKAQAAELAARLAAAEARPGPGATTSDTDGSSSGQAAALAAAQAEAAAANQAAAAAQAQAGSLQEALRGLSLAPGELEAAGLACAWLARTWDLADACGLYPEVAAGYAAQWRAVAPPPEALAQSLSAQRARRGTAMAAHQQQQQQQKGGASPRVQPGAAAAAGTSSSCRSSISGSGVWPAWMQPGSPGHFTLGCGTSVADLLEVQQGLTQLHALGLPAAVLGALAAARRPALLLPTAALDGSAAAGPLQPALGAEEAREARWAAAWLAYTWGRAAAAGVEPLIAEERAAAWGEVAEAAGGGGGGREAGPGLLLEVAAGLQELALLAVEQQVWQARDAPGDKS